MDIKQLRYFSKIAELGNMTRAAEALSVAQPALSQQLANLEQELGVRLLDRGVYGARLTTSGDYVYGQAKSIMRQIEHIKAVLAREVQFSRGHATLGVPSSIGRLIGEPLMRHFVSSNSVLLEIAEHPSASLVDLVAQGKIDLAVATDAAPRKGVLITPLFTEELYAVMSPEMAAGRLNISMQEISELPLLMSSTHTSARRVEEAFHFEKLRFQVVGEIGGTDMLVRLIAVGLGCSVLPFSCLDRSLVADGRIAALAIRDQKLERTISMCEPESVPMSNAARHVKEKVSEIMIAGSNSGAWVGSRRAV